MLESQLLTLGIDGKWLEPLKETFEKYQIDTPKRQAAFIGQCMHESNGFKTLTERLVETYYLPIAVTGTRKAYQI